MRRPALHASCVAAAAAVLVLAGCGPKEPPRAGSIDVAAALRGGDTAGYARATAPRTFSFPEDDGPHPEFRTEWWYYTGNLDGEHGERFGFQLTFFRNAVAPSMEPRTSQWATRQVYMAHFALTDAGARRFHDTERFARAAAGLAGADSAPFHVWVENWDVHGTAPFRLHADDGAAVLDLTLEPGKPPVLQGDRGLSQKGPEPGNASYYYSRTRMPASGTVTSAGRTFEVSGSAWMDREWSTSALGPDLAGWDWFALQLADGRDLMVYRLRRKDGTADRFSHGTLVAPDGTSRGLTPAEFTLEPQGGWISPRSGARYPAAWRVRVPADGLDLTVTPVLADQELSASVVYWEGAVDVTGSANGRGYLEMTGYPPLDR